MSAKKQGFLQALGVTLYCSLVGVFIWNANSIVGKMGQFLAPILFLLLFSTSALICGVIVLYKPYKLFIADKKKEAVSTVLSTAVWLVGFLALAFVLVLILR